MKLRSGLLPVVEVLICLSVACEPGMEVVYTNNTSQLARGKGGSKKTKSYQVFSCPLGGSPDAPKGFSV